jgi:23S rRNA (adenine2503-C2)-methyltransferase
MSKILVTREKLAILMSNYQSQAFRVNQIINTIYKQGYATWDLYNNLPQALRIQLQRDFPTLRLPITKELLSKDGTKKWLIRLEDGNEIETVFIPEKKRGTVCLSSQVGCTLTCKFCHTGTQKLVRNLTSDEIITQVMIAKDSLEDWPVTEEKKLTNIVFMGMGEPFLNYDNLVESINILRDAEGLNYGKKRITISTSGLVPQIEKAAKELKVRLAISLHAVRDDLRDELVPINRKYPIKELLEVCKYYSKETRDDRITFEYVMLKDVNDSDQEAKELVQLLKNIKSKVNLIPFNPWPGTSYSCSTPDRIKSFAAIIEKAGYQAPIRITKGQDIMAACGQLKSESLKVAKGQEKRTSLNCIKQTAVE